MPSIAHLCSTAFIAVLLFAAFSTLSTTPALRIQSYLPDFLSTATMSSQGWHARASPHPAGPSYEPSRSDLLLVLKHSAPANPEGFSLALLAPDVAINALGQVLTVPADDFATLRTFTTKVADDSNVLDTGLFGNQWR